MPPWFTIASETIKAFPTFLPSAIELRHADPDGMKAHDARLGYVFAVSWSLAVAIVVANSGVGEDAFGIWLLCAAAMLAMYEVALRMEPPNE